MAALKQQLLDLLAGVDGVTAQPSPVAGGTALFCRGKEFAHFHHDHELDLRLTRKLIASLGLSHPAGSIHHPARSANSAWIEVRFHSPDDVQRAAELVRLAVAQR
ncbi:luciferase family protein [Roseateles sp. BYS78W]|uniref:Luciferase family protein n=1 Tax=Pelomonas candidula TaxID=3299025 RepID=A0ABW7H5D0_9BURK